MITAIIVDDEINGRENIEHLLIKFCPGIEIIGLASSADEGLVLIKEKKPQLIFLDVEMPFKSGFDMLDLVEKIDFDVIFTTAHDHYALRAIKFSALDYLLKPIDISELKDAVQKLILKKENKNSVSNTKNYELLLSNLKKDASMQRISVPTNDGFAFINISDIIRCESDGNYTRIFTEMNGITTVSKTLKEFEDILTDMNFFRIHKNNLVNLIHIKKYIRGEGGFVILSDNISIEVSRRKKPELLNRLHLSD